jgi:hypothetical protein
MRISKLILVVLLFVFVLTACQLFSSGSAPAKGTPTTEVSLPTAVGAIPYPETSEEAPPLVASSNVYPSPETQLTPQDSGAYPEVGATASPIAQSLVAQTEPVYPDLNDGAEVAWPQVQGIIFSGQVAKVGQTHDLNVYLTLKDGRTFKTVEPAIDDVLKLIQACGDLCKEIRVATQ